MSLREKTLKGLKWGLIENFGLQAMQFIIGIVLARLLSPAEFGLMGIVLIFLSISDFIINSGLSQALIRKASISEDDYTTAFYFNLTVAASLYLILFSCAGLIGGFFTEQRLRLLIQVGGINLLINALSLVPRTYLTKNLNFKKQTQISLTAALSSGTLGIASAFMGFGVWSLVIKTLSQNLISTLLLWKTHTWRAKGRFSRSSFNEMYNFGSKLLFSSLLEVIYQNIYSVIIGKYFSKETLGLYSRAQQFQSLVVANIMAVVGKISYPALATIQHDTEALKGVYRKMLKTTMLFCIVFLTWLYTNSAPVVLILLGAKWAGSIIYLKYLSVIGLLYPLHVINLGILQLKGRSDLFLILEIIKKCLAVPVVLVGIKFGIITMLQAMIGVTILGAYLNSYWSGKLIAYSIYEQVKDIVIYFLLGLITILCGYFLGFFVSNVFISLAANVVITVVVFYGLLRVLRDPLLNEIKSMAKTMVHSG